ncbi:MAG: outer membrane protein assembly factor BamD [Bacteroidales bacterium]|nr:outer membrane protein assembly factor BamD [Bacteroidales bacterium]
MRQIGFIIAVMATLTAVASCSSQFETLLNSNDVDTKYEAAFQYFNTGKYSKAATLFESLSVLTSGTAKDDTVQYYWALSNYRFRDFYTAETNFSRFVENYPRSPFSPEARFLRVDCLYRQTYTYELDQLPTQKAMTAINLFISEYPMTPHRPECESMLDDLQERVDTKAYEGAKLYYKMEDYLASRVAFRNVLKDNSDNMYREDILYYTAMSSYKYAKNSVLAKQRERYLVFIDDYLNFIGEIPESPYRKELDSVYKRAQKSLGRDAVIDAEIEMKEKAYAKERKEFERALKQEQKKRELEEKKARK